MTYALMNMIEPAGMGWPPIASSSLGMRDRIQAGLVAELMVRRSIFRG